MSDVSKVHEGQELEEAASETLQDTGVEIYHAPTGAHYAIKARVKRGEGKVFVNGIPNWKKRHRKHCKTRGWKFTTPQQVHTMR